mmetsp:Transcript_22294/g.53014  ORF Transcript_22294/g.53014 Transcript_22294/m.53014 type:complete len:106 (-) Transcript_22294:175-492(-)
MRPGSEGSLKDRSSVFEFSSTSRHLRTLRSWSLPQVYSLVKTILLQGIDICCNSNDSLFNQQVQFQVKFNQIRKNEANFGRRCDWLISRVILWIVSVFNESSMSR